MSGYSGTPLSKKLGIKPGHRVCLLDAPPEVLPALGELPEGVHLTRGLRGKAPFDVILLFATREAKLHERFPKAQARLTMAGGLWVCWPKKASKKPTDLGDAVVRAYGLSTGLVDNKVCAFDATWSALRFVVRVKDR